MSIIFGITLAAGLLRSDVSITNLAMLYLLGVVGIAVKCSRPVSVLGSVISVAAFDFVCVPPYGTLRVSSPESVITLAGMLIVALVISAQTARIRRQATQSQSSERRTQALYRLSRRLAEKSRGFDAARTAAEVAEELFEARVVVFLPDAGRISFRRRTSDVLPVASAEEEVAQWVFEHRQKAGRGLPQFGTADAFYLPLAGAREVVGVMAFLPRDAAAAEELLAPEQQAILDSFAGQAGLAMENLRSQAEAERMTLQMETEQMRSSLLSAVSHDLRTPLATITGAASALRSQGERMAPETREELLDSISDEAERLSRLVSNLLDMTRLESGIELRRDLYPLEEIVGSALQRMEPRLGKRPVRVDLPDSLPLVYVDDVLLGQVIVNLVENALKYTPAGTALDVMAGSNQATIWIDVADRGPGFTPGEEERVFDKFYRGRGHQVSGAGLGLAICKAIVRAHQGAIEALQRPGGGALVRITLPRVEDGDRKA
jgi:two-component system sensor histidine kinase KdpD